MAVEYSMSRGLCSKGLEDSWVAHRYDIGQENRMLETLNGG